MLPAISASKVTADMAAYSRVVLHEAAGQELDRFAAVRRRFEAIRERGPRCGPMRDPGRWGERRVIGAKRELRGLDVDLLTAFDALLAERNVTRAAARLGLSQPALSARLTRLRRVLGDRLFVPAPSGRGVVPTPHALTLAPIAADVLERLSAMLEATAFDPATTERTFTIALHENPAVMLSPDLVPRLQAAAPMLRLVLALPDKERMPALLERGEVDMFIGVRAHGEASWQARTLFEDDFAVAQRKGHPRGRMPMTIEAFCAARHLLVSSEGDPFFGLIDDALASLGQRRAVAVSIQSYAVAPTIVAASDLLCTLPRRFLERYADTLDVMAPPLALPPVEVTAYWHPRSQDDPGHRWLRDKLFKTAGAAGRQAGRRVPAERAAPIT